ncbi:MAG: MFS transporter [Thermodesulfobacteriota bacterium]
MNITETTNQTERPEMNISLVKANCWFIVIWLIWICDYVDRMAVNAVLPILKTEFSFTDSQLGLISSVVGVSISVLAPITAILADKWSRRKLISIMVITWSIATFMTGRATGYFSLIAARLGVGVGEAGYAPSGTALISAWYPKKIRGVMMGLWFSGTSIGVALGVVLGGILAHKYGWRSCFGILAIPGILLAALAWFLPDYKAIKVDNNEKKTGALREAILYIFNSPSVLLLYFSFASVSFSLMSFSTWGVSLFVREFGINVKEASFVVGVSIIVGVFGDIFVGWSADKLMKKSNKGRLLAGAFFFSLYAITFTAFFQIILPMKSIKFATICYATAAFFCAGVLANLHTTVQDIVSPFFRSTAAGFIPFITQMFGAIPGPVVAGYLSERYGLPFALQTIVVISTTLLLLFLHLVSRFYDRDVARAKALGEFVLHQN